MKKKILIVDDEAINRELLKQIFESDYDIVMANEGRTGDRFMSLCKSGQILNCCHPNALMTLTEYLVDYASEETKKVGYELIEKELSRIPNDKVREIARKNIDDIRNSNRRDFRF